MAKYIKFQINETVYSIIKINDDGSALQVGLFSGGPVIEFFDEVLDSWSEYVEATKEEFIDFYQKVNTMIIRIIMKEMLS